MFAALPSGYIVRAPDQHDIPAIIALIAAYDIHEFGDVDARTEEDLLDEWKRLDSSTDSWLIFAESGTLVGYGAVSKGDFGRINEDGYVHPDHTGRGVGVTLLKLMEARARELEPSMPEGIRVAIYAGTNGQSEAARALFHQESYTYNRSFWRMEIDMTEPPPAPEWPAGLEIRTFVPGKDERGAYDVVEDAFVDHWGHFRTPYEEYAQKFEKNFDPELWFLAWEGDTIAGATLCTLQQHGIGGWINKVAVRRSWRKRGLGMALLRTAFGEFYRRGVTHLGLGVDSDSLTGAQRLYEQAGMHIGAQYGVYVKELRPGKDLVNGPLSEDQQS